VVTGKRGLCACAARDRVGSEDRTELANLTSFAAFCAPPPNPVPTPDPADLPRRLLTDITSHSGEDALDAAIASVYAELNAVKQEVTVAQSNAMSRGVRVRKAEVTARTVGVVMYCSIGIGAVAVTVATGGLAGAFIGAAIVTGTRTAASKVISLLHPIPTTPRPNTDALQHTQPSSFTRMRCRTQAPKRFTPQIFSLGLLFLISRPSAPPPHPSYAHTLPHTLHCPPHSQSLPRTPSPLPPPPRTASLFDPTHIRITHSQSLGTEPGKTRSPNAKSPPRMRSGKRTRRDSGWTR
jgi:hypothetical protein